VVKVKVVHEAEVGHVQSFGVARISSGVSSLVFVKDELRIHFARYEDLQAMRVGWCMSLSALDRLSTACSKQHSPSLGTGCALKMVPAILRDAISPLTPTPGTETGQCHNTRAEENYRSRQRYCRQGCQCSLDHPATWCKYQSPLVCRQE